MTDIFDWLMGDGPQKKAPIDSIRGKPHPVRPRKTPPKPPRQRYRTETDKQLQQARQRSSRIARYWRQQGVNLAQPRRGDVGNMSGSQKLAELRRHEAFRAQAANTIAGARGARLNRSTWLEYNRLQKQLERRNEAIISRYSSVQLPGGQTVADVMRQNYGDRDRRMRPAGPGAPGELRPARRTASGFTSQAALERSLQDLQDRLGDAGRRRAVQRAEESLRGMLQSGSMGADTLRAVQGMSDNQKFVLFHMTGFMEEARFMYMAELAGETQEQYAVTSRDMAAELAEAVAAQVVR